MNVRRFLTMLCLLAFAFCARQAHAQLISTVSITGTEGTATACNAYCMTVWDQGYVGISANGVITDVYYQDGSTDSSLASALCSAIGTGGKTKCTFVSGGTLTVDSPYNVTAYNLHPAGLSGTGSFLSTVGNSYTGYVDPKYVVIGVTYAPPGPSASTWVQYVNSSFVGTTQSISNTFTGSNTTSVSLSYGNSIPLVGSGKITDTVSTTASQSSKNTSTVTTSIQIQEGEKTFGTGNYFSPVDNDYDVIWVWLNPAAIFTVTGGTMTWNGFAIDQTDQPEMDVVGIPLGYLNGHFGTMPPQFQTSLNRTWAANQIWAAGEGPALTSTDLAQIASADPFSVSTYGTSEIGYAPPAPETPDHRFTLASCSVNNSNASDFDYDQAAPSTTANVYTCTLTYTNTSTQAQAITNSESTTVSIDAAFTGSGFLKGFDADWKTSNTIGFVQESDNSITNTNTSSASLSVQGPPCNNTTPEQGPCSPVYDSTGAQPTQFDIYQDNLYGTFMFAPVHYY